MAHDHGEKILVCKPCGYYEVANGRFGTTNCKGCGKKIETYSSREWTIENEGPEFAAIPPDETRMFGHGGFVKIIDGKATLIRRTP